MAELGAEFSRWGIPTAAAVATVRRAVGPTVQIVASGGMRMAWTLPRSWRLARISAGMALPLFRAQQAGGVEGADAAVRAVVAGLRQALRVDRSRTVRRPAAQARGW